MADITLRKRRTRDEEKDAARATEHQEQSMLMQWCELASKRVPVLGLLFAIPNGGLRDVRVAAKLKREGVKAGVPDLCLPVGRGGYHALYIEMKRSGNKPTPAQSQWHEWLRTEGNAVRVCFSMEHARQAIEEYLRGGVAE
jgi:hypothetical protein